MQESKKDFLKAKKENDKMQKRFLKRKMQKKAFKNEKTFSL